MADLRTLQERLDRLYAELGALKREIILSGPGTGSENESERAWRDLADASGEISARWTGPGAVDEIRAQRER